MNARVISTNLARPETLDYGGKKARTGIYKEPFAGTILLEAEGVRDDLIADRRVHGGIKKAVYAYPSEHYPWWREKLGREQLPWGTFGENLTTTGIDELAVHKGDRFRIGTALIEATKPRLPCWKFGAKLGTNDAIRWMMESETFGIYFAVIEPGEVRAGDMIERLSTNPDAPTIRAMADAA